MSQEVSAKSGDGVKKAFYLLAAETAGIVVGTAEVEAQSAPMPVTIIDHARHDPAYAPVNAADCVPE